MFIKIDSREKDLFEQCALLQSETDNKKNIYLEAHSLPLGDVIISNSDNSERIIIERKSLRDLASSIRDGRYNEQSYRLNECSVHNHNIYYVVEGNFHQYKPGKLRIEKSALISAMISLNFYKGFSVHRTNDLKETAEFIFQLANKIDKTDKKGFYEETNGEDTSTNYSEVIKRSKKEHITQENIGEIMLSQIPHVSITSATQIMIQYKTIGCLLKALENNPTALDNITVNGKTGKTRRLNKTCIANIYKYLANI